MSAVVVQHYRRVMGIVALLVVFVFSLACGGRSKVALAVDHQPGPTPTLRIGALDSAAGTPVSGTWAPGIAYYEVPPMRIGPASFSVISGVEGGKVVTIRAFAQTPGPSGWRDCDGAAEALDTLYGRGSAGGLPLIYPERTWAGSAVRVRWKRIVERGTDNYHCTIEWSVM